MIFIEQQALYLFRAKDIYNGVAAGYINHIVPDKNGVRELSPFCIKLLFGIDSFDRNFIMFEFAIERAPIHPEQLGSL